MAQTRAERCVVITVHGSAENAVEALKAGIAERAEEGSLDQR